MKIIPFRLPVHLVAALLILFMVTGRWVVAGFDDTAFISAGSDFVDNSQTLTPIKVTPGQGYDGQFFYRLSLNPLDFSPEKYGVKLDFPAYRAQRIMYPVLVYFASFGGTPHLVPFAMILVNVIAFCGIFFFINRITNKLNCNHEIPYFVLMIFGLYMSTAKDLSEVTALFFYTATIWYLLINSRLRLALFSTLTLLTRETAAIAIFPLSVWIFTLTHTERLKRFFYIVIPFAVLLLWKYFVFVHTQQNGVDEGINNFTWPFAGIFAGMMANWNLSDFTSIMQCFFWFAYFIWHIWFCGMVLNTIYRNFGNQLELFKPVAVVYCSWFLFALCLSPAIYCDDWAFVRVFSIWNMNGYLVLIAANKKLSNPFKVFSALLLILTIIRLIIKT